MSELQLSAKLVADIQALLKNHDPASDDPGVTSQYLCAVVGFLLGQQDMPEQQKSEVLEQLSAFMKHVTDDVESQRQQASQPPTPPQQEAFGIWKPKT
ncbi:MAG: hypothetical protein KTR32_41690 [Granulosicoccus sp.]|nr:hypothetical protein [Granulosicoccus sp.]